MSTKVKALKRVAVALGFGSSVDEYTGITINHVLKEMAVKMQCAASVNTIRTNDTARILNYIADNYGQEEKEPYDLTATATNATVTIKRKGKTISPATDILYNGDVLTITAEADEGYTLDSLTVNDVAFESGGKVTVNGHHVEIVATGAINTYSLARTETSCTITVTKGGESVEDGENVLDYGDEITITAVAAEGSQMSSLKVNGEDFTSGNTLTVDDDVEIVGVAE